MIPYLDSFGHIRFHKTLSAEAKRYLRNRLSRGKWTTLFLMWEAIESRYRMKKIPGRVSPDPFNYFREFKTLLVMSDYQDCGVYWVDGRYTSVYIKRSQKEKVLADFPYYAKGDRKIGKPLSEPAKRLRRMSRRDVRKNFLDFMSGHLKFEEMESENEDDDDEI